jgi:hypothetical protein
MKNARPYRLAPLLLAGALALPLATPAHAEWRALLVGVGKYTYPGIDLPGIDLDLERMRDTLNRLGFQDSQIRTLVDEEATSGAIIANFEGWLRQGVKKDDHVVFYFSGHGSNVPDLNGDEPDGADEVLVTHDMRRARVNGKSSLAGVLLDDKMGELLAAIPSRNVWVIVDACHSGTVTRSFEMKNRSLGDEPVFVKAFTYPGMPDVSRGTKTRSIARALPGAAGGANFVSLTAAGDGEKAIGTMKGGVFTIGLTEAITRLAGQGKAITVNELRDQTANYIRSKVDKSEVHHPQVNGDAKLAEGALRIAPATAAAAASVPTPGAAAAASAGAGGVGGAAAAAVPSPPAALAAPNRKRLLELAGAQARHFDVLASNSRYAVDEPVKLTMTLPSAGYLNVVTVDAEDAATVLFPNRHQSNNAVSAGSFTLPSASMEFDLLASEPLGNTLVVAFLSADPINFYNETLDGRDEKGNITVDFPGLSHSATRAIRIAPRAKEQWSGQVQMEIVKAAR